MTIKELSMGHAAQLALCAGVDVLADAVKSTLGPAGRHVALERPGGPPHATKDGAAVAGAIELRGRIENAAAQIVQQAAQRTADEVGDGTTTATVLAQAIFHEGVRHLAVGADASRLKQGIDQAARQMLDALAELSIPCSDRAALRQVATMAANADAEIGSLVAQALETVGHDGVVQVEAGRGLHSALHLVDGMQWEVGFASEHFANDAPRQRVHLEHPLVLVVAGALDAWRPLAHLLERVAASRQSLVIVAETFAADVMALLVANAQARSLGLCAVKAPGVGNRRGEILEDLALFAGSGHIAPASGFSLEQLDLAQLGSVDRFDADPRRTIFSAGPGHALAMQARLDPLRRRASQTNDVREREQLQQRVALLTGAVAVLRIGAATELEYRAKLDRADDALRSARAALRAGLVPGGGVAYLRARAQARVDDMDDPDVAAGVHVLRTAIQAPFLQILANAGIEALPELAKVERLPDWEGLNAASGQYGNLRDMGVVDATSVTCSALRHATSVAGMLLTTECVVTCA